MIRRRRLFGLLAAAPLVPSVPAAPPTLAGTPASLLPGSITYIRSLPGVRTFVPINQLTLLTSGREWRPWPPPAGHAQEAA